jgi:hypothetical protein
VRTQQFLNKLWRGDQTDQSGTSIPSFFEALITNMRNIVVFGGSSHPKLSEAVADRLGIPLGQLTLGQFSNKETSVQGTYALKLSDVQCRVQVDIPSM